MARSLILSPSDTEALNLTLAGAWPECQPGAPVEVCRGLQTGEGGSAHCTARSGPPAFAWHGRASLRTQAAAHSNSLMATRHHIYLLPQLCVVRPGCPVACAVRQRPPESC